MTPKVVSEINIPSYAWSSHLGEGTVRVSLDEDEWLEDDFQMLHTLVHHVVQWEDEGHRCSTRGRQEFSTGSPGQGTEYPVDIGEEEETLETIDPTWRAMHWLQLVVQGIPDDEVPWAECIVPLTMGTEDTAMSLAKCFLIV